MRLGCLVATSWIACRVLGDFCPIVSEFAMVVAGKVSPKWRVRIFQERPLYRKTLWQAGRTIIQ